MSIRPRTYADISEIRPFDPLTTCRRFRIVYVHGPEEHLRQTTTFRQTAISGVKTGSKRQTEKRRNPGRRIESVAGRVSIRNQGAVARNQWFVGTMFFSGAVFGRIPKSSETGFAATDRSICHPRKIMVHIA